MVGDANEEYGEFLSAQYVKAKRERGVWKRCDGENNRDERVWDIVDIRRA